MAGKLFIDSDVVIDFLTDREPFANPASEIFELNEREATKPAFISYKHHAQIYWP